MRNYPIFKSTREAFDNDEFAGRFYFGADTTVAPAYTLYATNEYVYDRLNRIKYSKRFMTRKPSPMTRSELGLAWMIMDMDVKIRKYKS